MSAAQLHSQEALSLQGGSMAATMTETMHRGLHSQDPDGVAHEIGMLLRGPSRARFENLLSRDIPQRSGSAPPSVEGSLAGVASLSNLFHSQNGGGEGLTARDKAGIAAAYAEDYNIPENEKELRSDPAYLAYYYSHINLNPRLPPPLISWENWRLAQRLQAGLKAGGGFDGAGRLRGGGEENGPLSKSLFATQPVLPTHREEEPEQLANESEGLDMGNPAGRGGLANAQHDWQRDPGLLLGLTNMGLGAKPKSLVDLIQEDFPRTPSPVYSHSRNANRDEDAPSLLQEAAALHRAESPAPLPRSATATPKPLGALGIPSPASTLSGPPSVGPPPRHASPAPIGTGGTGGLHEAGGLHSLSRANSASASDLTAQMQGLRVGGGDGFRDGGMEAEHQVHSRGGEGHRKPMHPQDNYRKPSHRPHPQDHPRSRTSSMPMPVPGGPGGPSGAPPEMFGATAAAAVYQHMANNPAYFQNMQAAAAMYGPQYAAAAAMQMGGFPMSPTMVSPFGSYPPSGMMYDQGGAGMHPMYRGAAPQADPMYIAYLQRSAEDARMGREPAPYVGTPPGAGGALLMERGALGGFGFSPERRPGGVNVPAPKGGGHHSPGYYGSPPGVAPMYPGPAMAPLGGVRREERMARGPPVERGRQAPGYGQWGGVEKAEEARGSGLLEEFKNSKTRRFELADIVGHVVEFSADQHGSRFIQQKLEVAPPQEKQMIFEEVLPRALTLMTDVFGNYVIQKFFEHGTPPQRRELAKQLQGHVLALSLQMYGCRVIQKALEVVDRAQQSALIAELDGQVMRCVRDQNGNHVIQKCIECVPADRIGFIVNAFYGNVVSLSTHPYGCRVIQRVLEHCPEQQAELGIMDEILRATTTLAQDQYGNYVVQHVLEHGQPAEKKDICTKLAGQIVAMSQHKFASNVVEKCVEHGGPAERQLVIKEMLGPTDENEPLQAMMKDQFANYVVQKVLEVADEGQREYLLGRIKVHLHTLKKFTYGKHIVARVEKLIASAENPGSQSRRNDRNRSDHRH